MSLLTVAKLLQQLDQPDEEIKLNYNSQDLKDIKAGKVVTLLESGNKQRKCIVYMKDQDLIIREIRGVIV